MEPHFELNEVTKKLPKHLHKFVVKQPYDEYTAQNQAVWRYVMRMNVDYLGKVAHASYLDGLKKTGISVEKIPHMQGMNRILKEIGWAAVSVDGFIPPNAFMEFQAYNVLVIASDMRTIDHIEYTPAPDIIHEAAGHAPIIANPEYAEYLRRFGEIGAKAISSAKDYEMYEAIRLLSILKEDPNSTQKEIDEAQEKVEWLQDNMGELSEMAQIRNLHWWTVEYGLIGTLDDPKIYGAGLLSSIGESKWCMKDEVEKVPYTLDAANVSFDITKPQPQLFVTPDFAHLSLVLEQFANKMAIRTGGLKGIEKLIDSKNLGTIELSTGIQISGVFTNVITDESRFKSLAEVLATFDGACDVGLSITLCPAERSLFNSIDECAIASGLAIKPTAAATTANFLPISFDNMTFSSYFFIPLHGNKSGYHIINRAYCIPSHINNKKTHINHIIMCKLLCAKYASKNLFHQNKRCNNYTCIAISI